MSPRRRIEPDTAPDFAGVRAPARRRWVWPLLMALAAMLTAAAVATSVLVAVIHERHHRSAVADVEVTDFVRSFMVHYTSPDPFHANDYAQAVLDQSTGQLAQMYKDKINEIVITVARSEPTAGSVLDAGVERWNDDGSADVVVATQTTTTMPDGNKIENVNRWVATAKKEGAQWKISNLLQVI